MNPEKRNIWKTAGICAAILAFFVVIYLLVGCSTPKPVFDIAKAGPPDPCPECPKCTNCIPTNTWPAINTNGIWLELVSADMSVSPARIVTRANNLTNGMTYRWWRTDNFGLLEWIPLSTFVATTNFAYRTNGIATPSSHFFKIEQLAP